MLAALASGRPVSKSVQHRPLKGGVLSEGKLVRSKSPYPVRVNFPTDPALTGGALLCSEDFLLRSNGKVV